MNKKIVIMVFFIAVIIIASFSYGFLCFQYKLPPYYLIRTAHYNYFIDEPDLYPYDVSDLIEINNESDILEKRSELIDYIWKGEGLPINKFPVVEENIIDNYYTNLKNLKQIDKLTVNMDHNVNSIIYHFRPVNPNNHVIIYHQGHAGDFINGHNTINEFLGSGFDVISMSMPLLGMNNKPEIEIDRFGKLTFENHNQFYLLDSENFSSIKFFIEPVISVLNYIEKLDYKDVSAVGLSAGGWTIILSSAIDQRIINSYPVAGSYPLYLLSKKYNEYFTEYELILPDLYRIANYLELYIMSAYGENRNHIQIFNVYDSCCYSGFKFLSYENVIYNKMQMLDKGEFMIVADDTHYQHKISEPVLKFIIDNSVNS